MRFRGGGVGHKSTTRKATDCFLSDRDRRDLQASMENEAEDDEEDPSNVEVLPDDEDQEPEAQDEGDGWEDEEDDWVEYGLEGEDGGGEGGNNNNDGDLVDDALGPDDGEVDDDDVTDLGFAAF